MAVPCSLFPVVSYCCFALSDISLKAVPCAPPSTVTSVGVPEQVAVPLASVALVGDAVAPYPVFVTEKVAPVQLPEVVNVTVAVAPVAPLLNELSVQVPVPLIVPPLPEVIDPSPVATKPVFRVIFCAELVEA